MNPVSKRKPINQPTELLTDIGVTLVVFIVAITMLGITNYQNHQAGSGLDYKEIEISTNIADPDLADTIYLFHSKDEVRQIFPQFTKAVDWNKQVLMTYIASPQSGAGYQLKMVDAKRQGPIATLQYRLQTPLNPFDSTIVTQPVMFVTLTKSDLVSSSQFTFRFQNIDTNQTSSLSIFPNEI